MIKKIYLIVVTLLLSSSQVACGHTHSFIDATCTESKACTECGETEGEPLGHLIDVGLCSRCNKIVSEDVIKEVMTYLGNASEAANASTNEVKKANTSSSTDMFTRFSKADGNLIVVKENMQKAYELCDGYTGLDEIKEAVENVLADIPSKISGSDSDSLMNWLNEYKTFLSTISNTFSTVADFANSLAQGSN